jgi:hypothetical protein
MIDIIRKMVQMDKSLYILYFSLFYILIASCLQISSIFVNYVPNKKIENCSIHNNTQAGSVQGINYCDLHIALPAVAASFGFISFIFSLSCVSWFDNGPFRYIKKFIGVLKGLSITNITALIIAIIFSAAALAIQLGEDGIDVKNNEIDFNKPQDNVGFVLSLTALILFFISLVFSSGKFSADFLCKKR